MKLAEAEKKLAEKNLELIQKEGEFQLKRNTDRDTIKKQQKELGGLRKYMETAEASWDWLISGVLGKIPLYSSVCAKPLTCCANFGIAVPRSSWI
jgi:hypothetical protein